MSTVHVAAGVVVNQRGEILVAKRPEDKHQGGLWEFPGGKIEAGESAHQALLRELEEEVGIRIGASEPLITITHSYPDKTVCLHVLRASQFEGSAWGREGQEIAWTQPDDLLRLKFPAANTPIVAAARLPRRVMITGNFNSEKEFLRRLQQGLDRQAGLVQFRAPWLGREDYVSLAEKGRKVCQAYNVPLMVHWAQNAFDAVESEGLHLTSKALQACGERPVPQEYWLSAACHTQEDVEKAQYLGVDFVYVSPVETTATHPETQPIGWQAFADITEQAKLPVFALGGMGLGDVYTATSHGAQGIAAVNAFWRD